MTDFVKIVALSSVLLLCIVSCSPKEAEGPFTMTSVDNVVLKSEFITDEDFNFPFNIILPSDYETSGKKYPVLYLFHGVIDDHNAWKKKGDVVRMTEDAVNDGVIEPFIIVLPNAYLSFYVDSLDWSELLPFINSPKLRFESFFTKTLQPYMESHYPVLADREHTAIVGLSMGGYGASYHAFKYPDKYCYCASISGAVKGGNWTGITDRIPSVQDIFEREDYSRDSFKDLPEYVMDCGDADPICGRYNEEIHEFLDSIGFPHEYRRMPGTHAWNYWKEAYKRMLPELARHFNE